MGYKLHRNRTVFRRRRPWRVVVMLLVAVLIVAAGFFIASLADKPAVTPPDSESTASVPEDNGENSAPPIEESSTPPATDVTPTADTLRGFTLPLSALQDSEELAVSLQAAAKAGMNTLLIDLKDAAGRLYYRFEAPQAQRVNSYTDTALTADELKAAIAAARQAGIGIMPRLYTFEDNAGARALGEARITHTSDPSWVWYDADPKQGGKAWLNPYADEAHLYIISLCEELKAAGVSGVMLDGMRFPGNTYSASFGSSASTAMKREDILAAFVDKVQAALGKDCPVLLGAPGKIALGVDTGVYGGNPITFGPDVAVPRIDLAAMAGSVKLGESTITVAPDKPGESLEAVAHHMALRLKVTGQDTRLAPWIETKGLSNTALTACIEGCVAAEVENFILHHPDGQYDWTAIPHE